MKPINNHPKGSQYPYLTKVYKFIKQYPDKNEAALFYGLSVQTPPKKLEWEGGRRDAWSEEGCVMHAAWCSLKLPKAYPAGCGGGAPGGSRGSCTSGCRWWSWPRPSWRSAAWQCPGPRVARGRCGSGRCSTPDPPVDQPSPGPTSESGPTSPVRSSGQLHGRLICKSGDGGDMAAFVTHI